MHQKISIKNTFTRFQSGIALLLMILVMSFLHPSFLTVDNGWNILRQISINLCLSLGMTLVILTGGIDLSVGSILALAGAVTAGLLKHGCGIESLNLFIEFTVLGAILGGLLVGGFLGFFNGIMITRLNIPPFVATLGMLSIARGLTQLWTGGFPITGLGDTFVVIGTGFDPVIGFPAPVWISGILVIGFIVFTLHTKLGRYIFAVGGNEQAAHLSGVNVNYVKLWVYSLAGVLSAVGGILVTARLDSAQPNAGIGYELDSIAAVVIGGTSLSGGRGSILGTVFGCLIIGVLNNSLTLLNVSPNWQLVIKGLVILLAVAIDKIHGEDQ
ncbi:ribose ABC transporter permease [bacterium]|nr:ribose ABC transporter permease [bacterium]